MTTALDALSWRRFSVLVTGLSPNSALCAVLAAEADKPKVIKTPEELKKVWRQFTRG